MVYFLKIKIEIFHKYTKNKHLILPFLNFDNKNDVLNDYIEVGRIVILVGRTDMG
jgi:hypothetical protein